MTTPPAEPVKGKSKTTATRVATDEGDWKGLLTSPRIRKNFRERSLASATSAFVFIKESFLFLKPWSIDMVKWKTGRNESTPLELQ
jgi:hypothetical protein